jgi:hypothetical protein
VWWASLQGCKCGWNTEKVGLQPLFPLLHSQDRSPNPTSNSNFEVPCRRANCLIFSLPVSENIVADITATSLLPSSLPSHFYSHFYSPSFSLPLRKVSHPLSNAVHCIGLAQCEDRTDQSEGIQNTSQHNFAPTAHSVDHEHPSISHSIGSFDVSTHTRWIRFCRQPHRLNRLSLRYLPSHVQYKQNPRSFHPYQFLIDTRAIWRTAVKDPDDLVHLLVQNRALRPILE